MTQKLPRALIFDLDGVLTHTDDYHYLAWQRVAQEEGLPFDPSYKDRFRGMTRQQSVEILLGERQVSDETKERYMARKHAYFTELINQLSPMHLLEGVGDLLQEAKAQHLALALASSSKNAHDVCARLGVLALFDVICDGNSPVPPKPAPDIFLLAARQLGVSASDAVVFEDSQAGVKGALEGGFWVVGVGKAARNAHRHYDTLAGVRLSELKIPF